MHRQIVQCNLLQVRVADQGTDSADPDPSLEKKTESGSDPNFFSQYLIIKIAEKSPCKFKSGQKKEKFDSR